MAQTFGIIEIKRLYQSSTESDLVFHIHFNETYSYKYIKDLISSHWKWKSEYEIQLFTETKINHREVHSTLRSQEGLPCGVQLSIPTTLQDPYYKIKITQLTIIAKDCKNFTIINLWSIIVKKWLLKIGYLVYLKNRVSQMSGLYRRRVRKYLFCNSKRF